VGDLEEESAVATERVSAFTSDRARRAFVDRYQRAFEKLWPVPTETVDVPTRFGTARAYRCGRADGLPVVLLPGAGGNALMWYRYVEPLGRSRPVLALDPIGEPGGGSQDRPILDGRDVARAVDEVLTRLDLDQVHFVGASYGGWAALQHQLHCPGRTASVTLLDPAGFARITTRFILWVVAGGLAGFAPGPVRRAAAGWLHNATLREDELMRLIKASTAFRRRLPTPPALTDDDLRALPAPCLALLGGRSLMHDPARVADRIATLMPAGHARIIPGTGHDLPMARPDLVPDAILDFIQTANTGN
jgi:pimeloyl-ACP methyl ester carboxylesterase